MILDKTVILQTKSVSYDSEAMPTIVWTANNTYIRANIQDSNSTQMLIKDYSDSNANFEFKIFTEVNTSITKGKRIVDGSDSYAIMRVKLYNDHYELICTPVGG